MEINIDFISIALECQNRFKEIFTGENSRYVKTLFFSIGNDNVITSSDTPNVLNSAAKCILIHEYKEKAVTNWYSWYQVNFITDMGQVLIDKIDDEFNLNIGASCAFSNQWMSLRQNDYTYGSWQAPWAPAIKEAWEMYLTLKEENTQRERYHLSRLLDLEKEIQRLENKIEELEARNDSLEDENQRYKSILDDVKYSMQSYE